MIDLETLSQDDNAVIVTIAAVKFDFNHDEQETFCINLDPKDGKDCGFSISLDTIEWWKTLPAEVSKAWMGSNIGVVDGITQFNDWLCADRKTNIWANGIDFDLPKLRAYYKMAKIEVPWKYWNQNDCRTLFNVFAFDTKSAPRIGNYHNAVDDCRTQIANLKTLLCKNSV